MKQYVQRNQLTLELLRECYCVFALSCNRFPDCEQPILRIHTCTALLYTTTLWCVRILGNNSQQFKKRLHHFLKHCMVTVLVGNPWRSHGIVKPAEQCGLGLGMHTGRRIMK